MDNGLILAWRNTKTRIWTPVGILKYKDNQYYFNYTNGSNEEHFTPFGTMQDKSKTYVSDSLFPIFQNRLLSKSRPEYEDYLEWLDINKDDNNSILELSRSRGIRATDGLQLFPIPEKNKDGNYEVLFFSHGISHMSEHYTHRLTSLNKNEELLILKDIQNEVDKNALILRTKNDPVELLGYCPSFFVDDFNKLLDLNGESNVKVSVQKINSQAPLQLKLLCRLTTTWPKNFKPFNSEKFMPFKI
jgi:hypothetical protein